MFTNCFAAYGPLLSEGRMTNSRSQNRRGLPHLAESAEQNVPVPLSAAGLASPALLWTLVALTSAIGCHRTQQKSAPTDASTDTSSVTVPVSAAAVEVRAVRRRVSVVGTLHGFEQVTITPKVEGRVQALHCDVGDRVTPGQALLDLDPTDYRLAVEEAQQALNQELSRLDLQQPPPDNFDVEQLPAVESARLLLRNAEQKFERQKTLLSQNASSGQAFEQAETDLKVANAALRQARVNARTTLVAVKHRESLLKAAQQKLQETQVQAPPLGNMAAGAAGNFVVAKRMASVGEMIRAFPSTPVFELVMDDVLKLHVMIPERYLAQVQLGLDVDVRVEAYPSDVFRGQVARINPTVDPQSRSFEVEAIIPNPDHRLKHGGFAKAEVIVGTDDAAVTVPLEAVTRFAGVAKVFKVRDDSTVAEVEISIGTQGPGWVEAIGALQRGDWVVTSGQSKLASGTRVTVRESDQHTARRK